MLFRSAENLDDLATCYNYSVFLFFSPKLGRIQINDYLLRYNWTSKTLYDDCDQYQFHLEGMKQIFMSENCIIATEWEYLKNSNVVPFLDADDSYNGCMIVLCHSPFFISEINLINSTTKNNLMNY